MMKLWIIPFSYLWPLPLKALDILSNFQRPVFSLSVSQHIVMHKITNLWTLLGSIGRRSCERIMEEKTPLGALNLRTKLRSRIQLKYVSEKYLNIYSKTDILQREPFLNFLYQQLSIARYRVSFYANDFGELLYLQ